MNDIELILDFICQKIGGSWKSVKALYNVDPTKDKNLTGIWRLHPAWEISYNSKLLARVAFIDNSLIITQRNKINDPEYVLYLDDPDSIDKIIEGLKESIKK